MSIHFAPSAVKFVGADADGDGSATTPFRDIDEALAEAPDGSTLIFKAGSFNPFAGASVTLDRPLMLKGMNAVIR